MIITRCIYKFSLFFQKLVAKNLFAKRHPPNSCTYQYNDIHRALVDIIDVVAHEVEDDDQGTNCTVQYSYCNDTPGYL